MRLIVLFALVAAACSGGSGGREPTVTTGNVRFVSASTSAAPRLRPWLAALRGWISEAVAQVPGITVSIDGSSASATTDDTGTFRIEGNQFGPSVIRFTGSGTEGTLAVTLPASGFLRLVNVEVTGTDVTVEEQRTEFRGPLTGVDCSADLLQILAGELVAFRVRIQSETVIQDGNGQTLSCQDLITGREMRVQGTIDSSGTVLATLLQMNPSGSSSSSVSFDGSIESLDCPTEITVDRGSTGMTRVEISASTDILGGTGNPTDCTDLTEGASVHVEGVAEGGDVTASQIREGASPTPTS